MLCRYRCFRVCAPCRAVSSPRPRCPSAVSPTTTALLFGALSRRDDGRAFFRRHPGPSPRGVCFVGASLLLLIIKRSSFPTKAQGGLLLCLLLCLLAFWSTLLSATDDDDDDDDDVRFDIVNAA